MQLNVCHIFQFDYDVFFLFVCFLRHRELQFRISNSNLISQPQKLLKIQNGLWNLHLLIYIIKWSYLNYGEIIYALVKDVAKYLIFLGNKVQVLWESWFFLRNILWEKLKCFVNSEILQDCCVCKGLALQSCATHP